MIETIRNRVRSMRERKRRMARIREYIRGGKIPWSAGYADYRDDRVVEVLNSAQYLDRFRNSSDLPPRFGEQLDERIIEYPWTFARLDPSASLLLDAGSALNHEFLISTSGLRRKKIVFYTLSPETYYRASNLSYVFGDLRDTILRDATFHEIVCISTLEHIGMDNSKLYTSDPRLNEHEPTDYQRVMREFHRILAPGGRLIVTVPFGRPQSLSWLQVFDGQLLDAAVSSFSGELLNSAFYQYTTGGWILSDRSRCSDCEYFDVHSQRTAPDGAAAARAVACLELRR